MFASRSAMPSASSPNAGSRASRGTAEEEKLEEVVGVVVEARRLGETMRKGRI